MTGKQGNADFEQPRGRLARFRLRKQRCVIPMVALAVMCVLGACCVYSPALASAAGCTDTWVGPAEGTWTTVSSWSSGHVPTEADVACIGSGKSVKVTSGTNKVGAVQGEGGLNIGSLTLSQTSLELVSPLVVSSVSSLSLGTRGVLKGPGSIEISGAACMGARKR